jgi:hypothetical protein
LDQEKSGNPDRHLEWSLRSPRRRRLASLRLGGLSAERPQLAHCARKGVEFQGRPVVAPSEELSALFMAAESICTQALGTWIRKGLFVGPFQLNCRYLVTW